MDEAKDCPRCGSWSTRFHLADKNLLKDAKFVLEAGAKIKARNPMAAGIMMGASGSLLLADRMGLIKVYLCHKCHHPFVP